MSYSSFIFPYCHVFIPPFQIVQSADQLSVSNDAVVGLLKGAAEVLSNMSHDKVTTGMRGLVQLQVTPLIEVRCPLSLVNFKIFFSEIQLTQESPAIKAGTSHDPALWMDRLTALFRGCSIELTNGQPHPCQPIVIEVRLYGFIARRVIM